MFGHGKKFEITKQNMQKKRRNGLTVKIIHQYFNLFSHLYIIWKFVRLKGVKGIKIAFGLRDFAYMEITSKMSIKISEILFKIVKLLKR